MCAPCMCMLYARLNRPSRFRNARALHIASWCGVEEEYELLGRETSRKGSVWTDGVSRPPLPSTYLTYPLVHPCLRTCVRALFRYRVPVDCHPFKKMLSLFLRQGVRYLGRLGRSRRNRERRKKKAKREMKSGWNPCHLGAKMKKK